MSGNKAKRWCFTINMASDEDRLTELACWGFEPADGPQGEWHRMRDNIEYLHFQEEQGAQGTHHLQGFLILKKQERLSWLKRFHPRAHWEVARGTNKQADDYTRKEDTRVEGGMTMTIGSLPEQQAPGKSAERLQRAAEELDIIKEGYKRPAEVDSYVLMHPGFLTAYNALTADVLGPNRGEIEVITLVGPPGTGKSYSIQKYAPAHGRCICGNGGVWFQGATAEIMVFEEFCGQIKLQDMLQFLDPYPMALEVKGGMRPALYKKVIITSNTSPRMWYAEQAPGRGEGAQPDAYQAQWMARRAEALKALYDRLGYSNGSYIPVRTTGHYYEIPEGTNIQEARDYFDRAMAQHFPEEEEN